MTGLTPSQKEFIGSKFTTKTGSVLEVIGVKGKTSKCVAIFTCTCTTCSEDTEVFPEGSIYTTKGSLLNGATPCACSGSYNYSEYQYKILIERLCNKYDYTFLGFVEKFKDSSTKIKLKNNKNGSTWDTTSIRGFTRQNAKDPNTKGERIGKALKVDRSVHIKDFYSAGFSKDCYFWESGRISSQGWYPYWYYYCPICSEDEYVQNKLCTGVFEQNIVYLKRGLKNCRCSEHYKYTQEQIEFKIKKLCNKDNYTFIGWEGGKYSGCRSKFKFICPSGHNDATLAYTFIKGCRCRKCSQIARNKVLPAFYGYYQNRENEQDFLYIIIFKGRGYIKVGRTFNFDKRLPQLARESSIPKEDIILYKLYKGLHANIYKQEQYIHNHLNSIGLDCSLTWSSEIFLIESLNFIEELIDNSNIVLLKNKE